MSLSFSAHVAAVRLKVFMVVMAVHHRAKSGLPPSASSDIREDKRTLLKVVDWYPTNLRLLRDSSSSPASNADNVGLSAS